jgi:hypothetical protein
METPSVVFGPKKNAPPRAGQLLVFVIVYLVGGPLGSFVIPWE